MTKLITAFFHTQSVVFLSFGRLSVFFIWSVVGIFDLVSGRCLSFGRWSVVGGLWSVVGGLWSVMRMVDGRWFFGRCDRCSVSVSVGGRCFMFLIVGSRFFLQWSVVGGSRSVVGGWLVILYYALLDQITDK